MNSLKINAATQAMLIKYGLLGLAAGGLFFYIKSKGVQSVTRVAAGAAVGAVDDVASGLVIGIGEQIGIPETSKTMCEVSKKSGDKLAASFHCSASEYLRWLMDGAPQDGASGSW